MIASWDDVARLLSDARYAHEHQIAGSVEALLLAVEAMAELLTPPAGITERLAETVQAEADDPLAGWDVDLHSRRIGGYTLSVRRFTYGWAWQAQDASGVIVRDYYYCYGDGNAPDPTAADAARAATAWAKAQVTA